MNQWTFIGMTVCAGFMFGFQSPINTALSKRIGFYESAFVSFSVGILCLLLLLIFFGKGNLSAVTLVPWWQLLGGVLGAVYLIAVIVAVPQIGVTTVIVAILIGQLTVGLLVDNYGWFGVPVRTLNWHRMIGMGLLLVSLWLIYKKS